MEWLGLLTYLQYILYDTTSAVYWINQVFCWVWHDAFHNKNRSYSILGQIFSFIYSFLSSRWSINFYRFIYNDSLGFNPSTKLPLFLPVIYLVISEIKLSILMTLLHFINCVIFLLYQHLFLPTSFIFFLFFVPLLQIVSCKYNNYCFLMSPWSTCFI